MKTSVTFKCKAFLKFYACTTILLLAMNANAQVTHDVFVGESYKCDATSAIVGSYTDLSWSSSGGYINLSGSGLYRNVKVTQYFSGTATVTCSWRYTLYYGGTQYTNTYTWRIRCRDNPASISPQTMTLYAGESKSVKCSVSYSNYASVADIYYQSENPNVAIVDKSTGEVTGVSEGTTYITAYSKVSANSPSCKVTVKAATPTSISLPSSLTVIAGASQKIVPTVYPSVADYTLSWSSSDESVATVSVGTVYGKKEGTTRITAKINGYNLSDYCDVTVKKPTLTLKADPTGGLLEKDSKVTLTANNNAASIYYTLDGSTPNENSQKYNAPIPISKNLTLKAIAYHPEYYDSKVLAVDYQVTSLKVVGSYPENGAENMGKTVTYSVTFNSSIQPGENFTQIKMLKNNTTEIVGLKIIVDNTFYFVPSEDLGAGTYSIQLPSGCVKTKTPSRDMNTNSVSTFSVVQSQNDYVINTNHRAILYSNGDLYRWGDGKYTYPDPSMTTTWTPCLIMNSIEDIFLSSINNWVLKSDKSLWGWGGNGYTYPDNSDNYLLGDGTKSAKGTPILIAENVQKMVINGQWHNGFIDNNNNLWLWGQNRFGQIGNGESSSKGGGVLSPLKVLNDVQECALGSWHTAALKTDGSVWVWGDNSAIGTSKSQYSPIQKMTDAIAIASGGSHVLVLKSDHSLWGFGENDDRQLGDGTTINRSLPVKIMSDVKHIGASHDFSMAIKEDGSLWCWGRCNGRDVDGNNPHKILDNVISAELTSSSCLALTEDGTLWGMGDNLEGQLGLGSETRIWEMTKITDNVLDFWSYYALKRDGSLWGWGSASKTSSRKTWYYPTKIIDGVIDVALKDVTLISQKSSNLSVNEEIVFQPLFTPTNGDYKSMTWSVDDESIATITPRGVLTAKALGTTTVRLLVETETETLVDTQKISITMNNTNDTKTYIADDSKEQIYTIVGNPIDTPQKGINIIRYSNGQVKKVLVK